MEELIPEEENTIDIMELVRFLFKKIGIILLCFCLGAGAAGMYTGLFVKPQYSSSATLYLIGSPQETVTVTDLQLGDRLTKDYQELVRKRIVIESIKDNLGLEYSYDQILSMITTSNPQDTRFMQITVTNEDPLRSQEIANELARVVSEKAVQVMAAKEPEIVEKAVVPSAPVSPNLIKNILMGGLLAAVLAAAVFVVMFMMDDTIKDADDVKKYLGLNTLASFPDERSRRKRK